MLECVRKKFVWSYTDPSCLQNCNSLTMEITHFSRKGQGLDAKNRSEQSSIGNTKQCGKIFHEVASDIFYGSFTIYDLTIFFQFTNPKKDNFRQILRKRSNSTR